MQGRLTVVVTILALAILAASIIVCCAIFSSAHEPVGVVLTYAVDDESAEGNADVTIESVVNRLNSRLRKLGTARVVEPRLIAVDLYGHPDAATLTAIKRNISSMSYLEFRILASPSYPNDQAIIELAQQLKRNDTDVLENGSKIAKWVTYLESDSRLDNGQDVEMVMRKGLGGAEVLALMDELNVTGEYLTSATAESTDQGNSSIRFSLNDNGANRLEQLTPRNLPGSNFPERARKLGVILDKRLLSAPRIQSTISKSAMISDSSMTPGEVNMIVAIFNGGVLPAPIRLVDEKTVGAED